MYHDHPQHLWQQLGDIIRNARKAQRWSQEQLGDEIGRDKATISRWETAKADPRAQRKAKGRELTRIFKALADGLDRTATRREFIEIAGALGFYLLDPSPAIRRTKGAHGQEATPAKGRPFPDSPSFFELPESPLPGQVRMHLEWLVAMIYAGQPFDVVHRCDMAVRKIRSTLWSKETVAKELEARAYLVRAQALIEALQPIGYGALEENILRAQTLSGSLADSNTRRVLDRSTDRVIGTIVRAVEDERRVGAVRYQARLHGIVRRFEAGYQRDPLLRALETSDNSSKIWAYSELIKKASDSSQLSQAEAFLGEAARLVQSHEFQGSPLALILPTFVFEGFARVLLRIGGPGDGVTALLNQAERSSTLPVNKFQIALTEAEALLKSDNQGVRIEGKDRIIQLSSAGHTTYQYRKLERMAAEHDLVIE